jgi:hypothetical protein
VGRHPFTKTLAVTIGRLRRKLGLHQLIETAIGVRYRAMGPPLRPSEHQPSAAGQAGGALFQPQVS